MTTIEMSSTKTAITSVYCSDCNAPAALVHIQQHTMNSWISQTPQVRPVFQCPECGMRCPVEKVTVPGLS